jgi:hypothetical protein
MAGKKEEEERFETIVHAEEGHSPSAHCVCLHPNGRHAGVIGANQGMCQTRRSALHGPVDVDARDNGNNPASFCIFCRVLRRFC